MKVKVAGNYNMGEGLEREGMDEVEEVEILVRSVIKTKNSDGRESACRYGHGEARGQRRVGVKRWVR